MFKKGKKSKGKKETKGNNTRADKNVEITFYAPEATQVYVAGEFNQWDTRALPMKKDKDGVWKAMIKLVPGRHEYKLFADNAWVEDIPGADSVANPFGTPNFVILVR